MQRISPGAVALIFALAFPFTLLMTPGCRDRSPVDDDASASQTLQERTDPVDSRPADLANIQRLISADKDAEASEAIRSHLVRYPNDTQAMELASEFFRKQGQVAAAVEMLDAAADRSTDGERSWRLRAAKWLSDDGNWLQAIKRLESLLDDHEGFDDARHELVSLLNQRGLRFDANEQARVLCRRGKARPDELRGLMFPTRSFTGLTKKPSVDDAELILQNGALNVARAMYSEGDVRDASQVLRASRLVQEKHPAAVAFYGQTLIESQQFDEFEKWLRNDSSELGRYPAYWMALGADAMRQRDFDAAVRRFAAAVLREPGDLAANDRMAQALAAGGHRQEQERFRQRGVLIDRSMTLTREVFTQSRLDPSSVVEISQLLTDAGCPLTALSWYRIALQSMGTLAAAAGKLDEALAMLDDEEFQRNNREKILCGVDLDRFPDDWKHVRSRPHREPTERALSEQKHLPPLDATFVNVAQDIGLDFTYANAQVPVAREFRLFEQLGSGVACLDYDLDGQVDFYLGQASGAPPSGRGTRPNLLARSLGNRFIDVTDSAACDDRGYTSGITSGDWNQDGFPDLVVANLMQNTLFINQGDGTFIAQGGDATWADSFNTTSVAMADVNGDHLPDIVEVNYVDDPTIYDPIEYKQNGKPVQLPAPLHFRPAEDRLFLSRGDGTMIGQLLDARGLVSPATGLGVLVTDIDGVVGNEIFVANDRLANHLWERPVDEENGTSDWQETAAARGLAFGASGTPLGCMGIAASDFDENGRLDLHVTNFENEWNNHFMQDAGGFFDDLVVSYGIDQPTYKTLGFGVQSLDYDNNLSMDLVIGNGHVEDFSDQGRAFEMPTLLFARQGSRFVPQSVGGDPAYWLSGHLSRGMATCDWNNDGRLDFAVTDLRQPFALLENRTLTPYHWLQLRLVGTTAERDAIGATVKALIAGRTITKVVQTGDGYMSKNQSVVSFGLGDHQRVDRLEVRWPDGKIQQFKNLGTNRRWLIIQSDVSAFEMER